MLARAGVPLIDVGAPTSSRSSPTATAIEIGGGRRAARSADSRRASGRLARRAGASGSSEQRERIDEALAEFAENTVEHVREESELLTGQHRVPADPQADFRDRHVLIVVRGDRLPRATSNALRAYIRDVRPLIVAVDGGADAVLEAGLKPDMILGDMDSASDAALACGAELDRPRLPGRPRARPRAARASSGSRTRSCPPPAPARTWRC